MIDKIIANGMSAAAVAALNVAVKLGLDYTGWCAAEDAVADRYRLERIPGASYQTFVDRAVGMADATLFFAHARNASIDLEKNRQTAVQRNKPFMLIDLTAEQGFSASRRVAGWIAENKIRVLHISGEREPSHATDPSDLVAGILEATFFLSMMETGVTSPLPSIVQKERFPQPADSLSPPLSLTAALDHLERSLSLKDKATIANMAAEELVSLHFALGDYINIHFDLFTPGSPLLNDCREKTGRLDLAPADAAAVIIRKLWERLRDTCRIRIVR